MSRKRVIPFGRVRARTTLDSRALSEKDEEKSSELINVLATEAEASMSSTSFTIPRRATIDADVSLFFI
jgi:hypothetical protein